MTDTLSDNLSKRPNGFLVAKPWMAIAMSIGLLAIDQFIKIWIKTHMMMGESIKVTDWFYIYFTENPGMAFGWELMDKLFLTVFRILASIAIAWLMYRSVKREYSVGVTLCLSAIFAGAVGNIIDSVFYGQFFTHSYNQVATFVTDGSGYADWMHGKVVDMFYFPIIHTTWPGWVPWIGGQEFIFFRPIFNFADACISVGVVVLILFYSQSFSKLIGTFSKNNDKEEI